MQPFLAVLIVAIVVVLAAFVIGYYVGRYSRPW